MSMVVSVCVMVVSSWAGEPLLGHWFHFIGHSMHIAMSCAVLCVRRLRDVENQRCGHIRHYALICATLFRALTMGFYGVKAGTIKEITNCPKFIKKKCFKLW